MNVFVAGGSGTIGKPLVRALVEAGHAVTALTRSPGKRDELSALGASVAIADALDRDALIEVVAAARPTHVVHQLTALPADGPRRASDLAATNRLRTEGTKNLLAAAITARASRLVVGSFALLQGDAHDDAAAAVRSMEEQVLGASARGEIEGVVLRYGLFYGPDTPSTEAMIEMVRKRRLPIIRRDASLLPVIHIDDAVSATVRALIAAPAGGAYDIVDDRPLSFSDLVLALAKYTASPRPRSVPLWLPRLLAPYMARIMSMRLPLSNARAKAELGWVPRFPTVDDGVRRTLTAAA